MGEIYSLGDWIRRRRKALDLTQSALAERVGCSVDLIQKIEADARRPSRETAARLADALGLAGEEHIAFVQAARAVTSSERLTQPTAGVVIPSFASPALAASPALPSGTVTFLLTDIAGSTRLWEQHPHAMAGGIARYDALLAALVAAHGGAVFKSMGDSVLAAFATAPAALAAALAAQQAIAAEPWGLPEPVLVRMGLHSGAAELREGDYYGPTLNRAARLLAAGHGGQVLLSLATVQLAREQLPAGASLRDLGEHRLKDLSLPEQVFQLLAPGLPVDFPALASLTARHTNLPSPLTALLGREQELSSLTKLLREPAVRLVTLSGPGGIGKTRLGLEAAAELLDDFADGVCFVDLAPISDPSLVGSAIAQTLGVREVGDQPLLESLTIYLRAKRLLLLLDNFEQIVDAAALIAEMLARCPQLTVLVTSRVALHLRGEKEIPVSPLALPDLQRQPPLTQLTQYAAVELFMSRALDAQPAFAVTSANAPAVAEICARLDGLPLAIELAAARIKLFAPQALLARLSRRLTLLTGGARDLPARQQSLRRAIAWSYDLLDLSEQVLFARLAVFLGGSTLDAAEAVCNASGDLPWDVLDGLTLLVDNNLLRRSDGVDGEPRFVMLETIREYALERLEASGEGEAIRGRHGAYFLALAERVEPGILGSQQDEWLAQLEAEHDNLRAALEWGLGAPTHAEISIRLAGALWRFWFLRGYFAEGLRWLERSLRQSPASPAARAKALAGAAFLADFRGDYEQMAVLCAESLALARELRDTRLMSFSLSIIGNSYVQLHDYAQAAAPLEESLTLAREIEDGWLTAFALTELMVFRQPRLARDTEAHGCR